MPPMLTISPLLDMKRPGLPSCVRVSDKARVGRVIKCFTVAICPKVSNETVGGLPPDQG